MLAFAIPVNVSTFWEGRGSAVNRLGLTQMKNSIQIHILIFKCLPFVFTTTLNRAII